MLEPFRSPGGRGELGKAVHGRIGETGEDSGRVFAHGMFIRRQVSTTERMAATLGPAC